MRLALLPDKHIRFCESLIGLAGCVRQILQEPRTIDEVWLLLNSEESTWFYKPSFKEVVIAATILFALGEIVEIDNQILSLTNGDLS